MMNRRLVLLVVFLASSASVAAPTDDVYKLGPDSMHQPGVAQGKVVGPLTLESKSVYPNTTRNYWVYVPAQYDTSKPACLMVFQDGHFFVNVEGEYRIPSVFDNLIYRREMPVTLAVFINPGHGPGGQEATDREWGDRTNNRGVEYNAMDDKYAKLIVDELLPELKKEYKISDNPDDRG